MTVVDSQTMLFQVLNWLILVVTILAVPYLVGRDARARGLSWPATLGWVLGSVFLFPVGVGLYLLVER